MNNVVNSVSYLRTSREFPEDLHILTVEVNKSYVDIAAAVNIRIIGIFPVSKPSITGESWFITNNKKQQSLRQVYTFTSSTAIPHNIDVKDLTNFSRLFGTYSDGTNTYGLIAGSNVAIAGQVSFYVDPTNINFLVGAGAPTISNGLVILEWISEV